ncbi:MAG: thioredoxin-dependent thiol peroxidase [Thaumarchaeota archaeon]|nr:MAG: thioredoxin-dependent thiol peroxidase [Nitrososphaerota archaeon]TLX88241.1 MAG: thioredoxin-dependent thiol peroxidase [Nitrososphaerota archaeon]TLX90051.1 MAG: thioredoxin-dependent thiol peroxidase [Nitrososphaerota archaeon]
MNNESLGPGGLKEGNLAPDFSFRSDNERMKLSDFRDRKVVVYFYPRDFTTGCTTEASEFTRDYDKFRNAGIEIIGISPDNDDSHEKFKKKMNISYHLASDVDHDISKKYGTYGLKKFMGREYMGVNRITFLIDEKGMIVKIFNKVKPAGHSKEVLAIFEITN